ncbi:MAG: peptidoglycan DD-metalloendopeptidase family protein [Firmicutes bacterium]|nr:peptidoglycan DD-metalloendopeptidase family protein [Bacillota bacterium]
MDEALSKNLDEYDEEQDSEEELKAKKSKEAAQTQAAQSLGDDPQGEKEVPLHSKLYQKLFYNSEGDERGGIAGWFKKKVDKTKDSGFFKTMSAILSNPVAKIGLGLGAYLFSDQIISFADKVSDVWQEHIPALWNFVSTTVVPAVLNKVGDITSWCVQALPGIFKGVANGLWTLVKDVGRKLGIGNRDITFGADQVDLETGTSIYGDTLVQYTDPETGETSYVLDKNGNYMTLGSYQYLSSEGTVENINRGTGYKLAEAGVRALSDPRTAKRMLSTTGAAIRLPSIIGKHIPIVGNVFKATDAMGKGLMKTAKNIDTTGSLSKAIVKGADERAAKYAFDAYDAHKSAQAAKDALEGTKAVKAGRKAGKYTAKAVSKTTDEIANGALKSVDKVLAKLAGFKKKFTKLMDESVVLKWFDYIGKTVKAGLKKAKSSVLGELASQIAAKTSKVLDDFIPFVGAAMTVYDAVKGWCDAEYLFDVPSGEETTGMRLISSVMNTLLGLSIGPIIDIILTFASEAVGYDIKKDIAQKLYVFFCELSGNDEALENYEEQKEVLQAELAAYNAAHPTAELSLDEYQKLKQKGDSWWNKVKNKTGWFGGGVKEDFSKYEEAGKMAIADKNTFGVSSASTITTVNQFMITDPSFFETGSVGNGRGPVGYGLSQTDPRWAKYNLGRFANGQTATMDLAGCGPTALANVASQLSGSNVSPVQVATMAKRKGYLTNGGANEALFDNGTEAFGLSSRRIGNSEIITHLKNGEKVIVSGRSASIGYGKTPFTPSGHIITLEGIAGNNVLISDPQDGSSYIQSLSSLTPELTHAWAFSNKGKSHILNIGKGRVGYGDTSLPLQIKSTNHKGYSFEEVGEFFRTYKSDVDGDAYYTGSLYDLQDQPWYTEWMTDRYSSGWGPVFSHQGQFRDEIDAAILFDKSKLTEPSMYFNQIRADALPRLESWFNGLSDADKKFYFTAWATNAAFDAYTLMSEKSLKDSNGTFDVASYQYLMDYYLFPKYGLENAFTPREIANIQIMRGYSPGMSGYMYNPSTGLPKELEHTEASTTRTSEDTKKIITGLENNKSWSGRITTGLNDMSTYWEMPIDTFMALSDPTRGGDPNIKSNWMYRYLWYVYDNALSRNIISKYDKIGQDLNVAVGAQSGFDLSTADAGVNLAMNDYTTNSERPYGLVNGIPYYYQNDERWASLNWKGSPFASTGDEIASLAMILSAYSSNGSTNRALTPLYMMQNWFTADHPEWWNNKGFTADFFSSKGIQSLKETFDASESPLRLEKLSSSAQAIDAMKNNKLILLKGRIKDGQYSRTGSHTLVGTYANDGAFILTDPQITGKGSEIILPNFMLDKIFQSGIVFSKSNGEGLGNPVDRALGTPEQSSSLWQNILEATKDSFLAPIAQFTSGIGSIIGNLAKALFNNKQYQSIFDTTYDSDSSGQIGDEDLDEFDYLSSGMSLYDQTDADRNSSIDRVNTQMNVVDSALYVGDRAAAVNEILDKEYSLAINNALLNGSLTRSMLPTALPHNDPFLAKYQMENRYKDTSSSVSGGSGYSGGGSGGGSRGGEYDIFDKASSKINSIFEKVFGHITGTNVNSDVDFDMNSGSNTPVDTSKLTYTDNLTAPGLVAHARKMMKLGARYVWGGSCEVFTEKYRNQLYQYNGDSKHTQQYYIEKYNKFAGKYVTDCSGLIRGYTKKSYNAHGLYTNSTQSGPISTVPNAPGYLVFRKSSDSDRMVHVGITTGGGKVIHCAKYEEKRTSDVKEENISAGTWTHWGKCHLLDYGTVGYGSLKTAAFDARVRDLDLIGYGSGSNAINYLTKTLGGHITQRVGYGVDPATGNLVRHRGTDIAANYGTPIHSPVSGKVVESKSAGYGSAYGNYTVIKDNHGSKHLFAHMDRPTGFGIGSTVHSGDVIGNVGNSGYSTGPHLHYEVRNNDHIIDPLNHKTNLNIIESRFDESMRKTSSPTGGENDIVKLASSLGATASNTDEIVNVLRRIADLLSIWQGTDEESKAAMLEALENSSGVNASVLTSLVNTSNGGKNNVSVNTEAKSDEDPVSTGGRALFNLIASK